MTEAKLYSPLKIGILIVAIAYFLFTLHALFTLSWIGEWEYLTDTFSFNIFVEDISAFIGLIFRFIASTIAVSATILYLAKKGLPAPSITKALRWILAFEAIYWLGLLTTAVISTQSVIAIGFSNRPIDVVLSSLMSTATLLVESIAIPIALFKLAFALNPNNPQKKAIKWGLITGTIYVLFFWLGNTSIWLNLVTSPPAFYIGAENGALYPYSGIEYVTRYPDHIVSFGYTTIGLLVVAVYAAYFTWKSRGTENWRNLDLRKTGAIITAVGFYFLLVYVMWLVAGTDNQLVLIQGAPQVVDVKWSYWYAWFLGHNLDLWLLSLPLVSLPLLFKRQAA